MFFPHQGFHVLPRGSRKKFPIQYAADGTPCILVSPAPTEEIGETIVLFPTNPATAATYPSAVEDKELRTFIPGDFLGVYTVAAKELMLQTFRIDSIHMDHLIATLADTLIIIK